MRHIIFLATLALMTGCKTSPNPGETTNVSPDRMYGFTTKSDAHLVVLRDTSAKNGCAVRLSIDGKNAADLLPGEIAHFGVTMGVHSLSARATDGCSDYPPQRFRVSVKTGDALIIDVDG